MTSSPMLLDPKMLAVRSRFQTALASGDPNLAQPATSLLDAVSQANWTLEWYLPRWLGDAFGLDHDQIQSLVLANIFGLCHVRLEDDLLDERAAGRDAAGDVALSETLYRLAIDELTPLFPAGSIFWTHLDAFMRQWRHSMLDNGAETSGNVADMSPGARWPSLRDGVRHSRSAAPASASWPAGAMRCQPCCRALTRP